MNSFNQNISMQVKQELALKPKMLQSLKMLTLPILELEIILNKSWLTIHCWNSVMKKKKKI